jgi:hypothetical protein
MNQQSLEEILADLDVLASKARASGDTSLSESLLMLRSNRRPGSQPRAYVETRGAADARALWAYRVVERATLVAASYSGDLGRHEALLFEKATALVAAESSLNPDRAPRAPLCKSPGCNGRALQQSSGPEGNKYYTGCTRHYATLGVKVADTREATDDEHTFEGHK